MKRIITTAILLLTLSVLFAEAPIVTNVTAIQRTDGSKIVDVTYDVSDADTAELWIELLLSDDGGATFTITPNEANLSGDVGEAITPRTGKTIIWNAGAETTSLAVISENFPFTFLNNLGVSMAIKSGTVLEVKTGTFYCVIF